MAEALLWIGFGILCLVVLGAAPLFHLREMERIVQGEPTVTELIERDATPDADGAEG